jgi:hypothetical protein
LGHPSFGKEVEPIPRHDEILQVNARLDVWVEGEGGPFPARVEEVERGKVWIAAPLVDGVPVLVKEGQRVRGRLSRPDGVYWFVTSVVARKSTPVTLLALAAPARVERTERRKYPRFPGRFPVSYRYLGPQGIPLHDWRTGETRDASEQALRVVLVRPLREPLPGQVVEVTIHTRSGAFTVAGWVIRASRLLYGVGPRYEVVLQMHEAPLEVRRKLLSAFAAASEP